MKHAVSLLLGSAALCMLAACTPQQDAHYAGTPAAQATPAQPSPAYSSTIPAQTYYFNPARAGGAGN